MYICLVEDGKRIRGGVLVGVVEALESHLSGICERQQREKNVRPLTFMDSAFTGYTPCMDSRRTPSGENGWLGRKLRPHPPLFVYSGGATLSLGSFRTPWRDFYASRFGRVFRPIPDDSLCFFTERWELRIVVVTKGGIRSREFVGYTRV